MSSATNVARSDRMAHFEAEALEAATGALAGFAAGAIAGPVGAIAGVAVGAAVGALAAFTTERDAREEASRERSLDAVGETERPTRGTTHRSRAS